MKVPKPKKLPSGSWRVQIMSNGKRISRTFPTERDAIRWAAEAKTTERTATREPEALTVGAATDRYIESKSAVLSPSTIRGYKAIKKTRMTSISQTPLGDLTQEDVQRWVNELCRDRSPKTVANAHGLLTAVLAAYRPALVLHTTLPQRQKAEISIPSESELAAIAEAAAGTRYELPIALAIWLGLRQSEIVGLRWQDIKGDTIKIRRAVVASEDGPVEKGTKTTAGTRDLRMPPYIRDLLDDQPHTGERVVQLSGPAIYMGFERICRWAGLTNHYRFHDLRHVNASIMLAAGVPDKFAMKRMGHATTNMLKNVYQHTMKEKEKEYDQQVDSYLNGMFVCKSVCNGPEKDGK